MCQNFDTNIINSIDIYIIIEKKKTNNDVTIYLVFDKNLNGI